ncbi:MAG: efflux RND transporter periplasmic adaptor subunit [Spirochaetaceae bacterium]|nr:MAG: efflux RND transporter periplasmic adaptor subunit [Spirochaetaceae bacterium]
MKKSGGAMMKKKPSRKKRMIWVIAGLGLLALLVPLVIIGMGASNSGAKSEVQTVTVSRGTLQVTISSTGTISAQKTIDVGTQVSGNISKIYADFNDFVRKGQLLAQLDTTLLDISVQSAEADKLKADSQYDMNLRDYNNNLALHEKGLVSDYDLETSRVSKEAANAARLSAEASLRRARVNLSYAVIRSPIDGIIIDRLVEEGQTVAAASSVPTLFTIAEDLSRILIKAYVAESDIGSVKKGQRVTFTVATYADDAFRGTVDIIHLQSQTVSNVVNYVVMVNADNPGKKLMPGMTATLTFIVDERTDALLVPNSALSYRPDEAAMKRFFEAHPEKRTGGARSAGGPPARQAEREVPEGNRAVLWYMDEKNELASTMVKAGLTDGSITEIISDEVSEGMKVLSASGRTRSSSSQSNNGNQGPPPGPRMF